jgi:pSer/pThr/pTyr-binding forkhead associated (FHA) protein
MKCMLCGTGNNDDAKFCKGCGTTIGDSNDQIFKNRGKTTVDENPVKSIGGPKAPRAKTRVVTPEQSSKGNNAIDIGSSHRSKTRYVAQEESEAKASAPLVQNAMPPVAGFLISYSWDSSGQWFPIRQGKNTYGSKSDAEHVIASDPAMSGHHFTIMCRKRQIRIKDNDSLNATMVDGAEVWAETVKGGQGTKIKAGETEFIVALIPEDSDELAKKESGDD